ncbi:hypothetical protein L4D13_09465 [Photobacterium profundum]|uniref:hypothetical protein n=1 Tax=Photobacterium profundum TaxID=74109 RepID=UPI003D0EE031
MSKKRNYIDEILEINSRNHNRAKRYELFRKRIHPLVEGFRAIKSLDNSVTYKNEWLKYGAIGYIGAMEGYFRLLIADLINAGAPYRDRITDLKDIKFSPEVVLAIHDKKISLGEFVSHLLPINRISDIDNHLSILLGEPFIKNLKNMPTYPPANMIPFSQKFPDTFGDVEKLFELRHVYAHELASKERVSVRKLETYIGSAAHFIYQTEELISTNAKFKAA